MSGRYTENDVPNQTGRTVLITGANTGIGFEAARAFSAKGARVLLGCRDESRAVSAINAIKALTPEADLSWISLDLASLDSVAKAGQRVLEEPRLDLLINNAGVMVPPKTTTTDGFELQFGVNHLGHFALTAHLLPMLVRNGDARIVTVSSLAHKGGVIDYADLQAKVSYSRMKRYQMSKYANLLFTLGLQRRLVAANSPSIALACHPGGSNTELGRHLGPLKYLFLPLEFLMNSSAEGALPTLRAATDPDARGADYYGPAGFGEFSRSAKKVLMDERVYDPEAGDRLWGVSEVLTGQRYHFD
ncbi:MAG: oxidoreductase [Candidatus Azotimanducaceae bacterium]